MNLFEFEFSSLKEEFNLDSFDCEDGDINEFLKEDAINYQREQMANTYVFLEGNDVIAFFSILNDCLYDKGFENRDWNKFHRKNKIPNNKRIKQYPAVKVGRLGVDRKYHGTGLAYELMDFIKGYSISGHKPACRLLLLDAYNKPKQLSYYDRNGFVFLNDKTTQDLTRLMYYDLIQFS